MGALDPANPERCIEAAQELLRAIPTLSADQQRSAVEGLVRTMNSAVRGPAIRIGAAVLSDDCLTAYLRNGADDVLRNAGLEMVKRRGSAGVSLAVSLLDDRDADVVLQAVLALDDLSDPRSLEPLRRLLHHSNANVVQTTLIAIGHLGHAAAVHDILPFLKGDVWTQMAAVEAIGNLRSPLGIEPLTDIMGDPLLGSVAAESLARIGGPEAFEALAVRWLEAPDDDALLELLAHVLEGLTDSPPRAEELDSVLAERMSRGDPPYAVAAARCLLVLGPGEYDAMALQEVAASHRDASSVPQCLRRRSDLIGSLLTESGVLRGWGLLLAARHPRLVPIEALATALPNLRGHEHLDAAYQALAAIPEGALGEPLLAYYARLPADGRTGWGSVLYRHRASLRTALDRCIDLPSATRRIITAIIQDAPATAAMAIADLPIGMRLEAVSLVSGRSEVVRRLPWMDWLEQDTERFGAIAAKLADAAGLRSHLPQIRSQLLRQPHPHLVRLIAALHDHESVSSLVRLASLGDESLQPYVLTALGELGGDQAREALGELVACPHPQWRRLAFKALASCATDEDEAIFRAGITDGDWYVRLICTNVLGQAGRECDLATLAQLTADPAAVVAERAGSFLRQ